MSGLFSNTALNKFNIAARQATETKKATRPLYNNSCLLVILPCEYKYKIQQRSFSTVTQTEENRQWIWLDASIPVSLTLLKNRSNLLFLCLHWRITLHVLVRSWTSSGVPLKASADYWLNQVKLGSLVPAEPYCFVTSKPITSMDTFEGQEVLLSPPASSITFPITAFTLPTSQPPSLPASLSYFSVYCLTLLFSSIHPSPLLPFSLHISLKLQFSALSLFHAASLLHLIHLQLFFSFQPFSLSPGPSPSSFYLPVSHYILYLSLSLLLPPPPLLSVPEASGSQQWIITHLRNSAPSVLLVQLAVGIAHQSIYRSLHGRNYPHNAMHMGYVFACINVLCLGIHG